MGLDTSHGCWHGAYSAFSRWRSKLAEVAGLPPLDLMEGFFSDEHVPYVMLVGRDQTPLARSSYNDLARQLPIRWDALKPSPLHVLLSHSDSDGSIASADCGLLADALEELIPLLPDEYEEGHIGYYRAKTQTFVDGLRRAAAAGEDVTFG